LKGKSLS